MEVQSLGTQSKTDLYICHEELLTISLKFMDELKYVLELLSFSCF